MDKEDKKRPYDDDDLLDTNQVAAVVGRNRRTVLDWIHTGALKAMRPAGTKSRFKIRYGDLKAALVTFQPEVKEHGENTQVSV